MIFRLSQKLNTKIKSGHSALPLDQNPFADWSAHLFVADQTLGHLMNQMQNRCPI